MVALRAIVDAGHDVAVVVSRADKRRGRQEPPRPSPVKEAAAGAGPAGEQPAEDAAEVGAELGVVVAFGRIIKTDVLDRLPLVNAHFSLLPRWRGRGAGRAGHPGRRRRHRRLPDGDRRGSRHRPGLPVRAVAIGAEETAAELRSRLADLGAAMLVDLLATGLGTPDAPGGDADLRRQDRGRRPAPGLVLRRRAAAPGGAVGPGLDDLAGSPAAGAGRPRRRRARRRRTARPPGGRRGGDRARAACGC